MLTFKKGIETEVETMFKYEFSYYVSKLEKRICQECGALLIKFGTIIDWDDEKTWIIVRCNTCGVISLIDI